LSSNGNSLIGTVFGGSYRIVRQIAKGGMGELYEASHLRLSGRYAIKVLLPEFASTDEVIGRFQREAEVTSRLRHPNIVSVIDFNTTPEGRAYLVMEYLDGRDLAVELDEVGPLPLGRVQALIEQLVSALSAAHESGVIHRDLKPQNLLLVKLPGDQREMLKVLDFGISKVREARVRLTRDFSLVGTPQYMAPEQALGKIDEIDHLTDQFAVAAVTYQLLAGRPPFTGEALPAILYQVVNRDPPALATARPEVPAEVAHVIARGLAKAREQRFADIRAFGSALSEAINEALAPQRLASRRGARGISLGVGAEGPATSRPTTFGAAVGEVVERDDDDGVKASRRRLPPRVMGVLAGAATLVITVAGLRFVASSERSPAAERAAVSEPEKAPAEVMAEDPSLPAAQDGLLRTKELPKLSFWKSYRPSETGRSSQSNGHNIARFKIDVYQGADLECGFDDLGRLELVTLVLDRALVDTGRATPLAQAFLRAFAGPQDRAAIATLAAQLPAAAKPGAGAAPQALAVYAGTSERATVKLPTTELTFDHLPGSQRRLRLQIQRAAP
jgi:hypothetical protein